ncbi:hypothetical protein BC833DRAFT_58054 [Globomyces pollinis-pini]|nr:hypothetical protein BC833DRAFT_58054 [Globomyces pollinis-pini]KAJ2996934.1 hypothetical protein HDV02_006026 [Globomyces sp. JEL0801]
MNRNSTQILENFDKLCTEYSMNVQLSSLQIKAVIYVSKQRSATLKYQKTQSTFVGNRLISDSSNFLNSEDDIPFLEAFPHIHTKLVYKQTTEIENHIKSLKSTLQTLQDILNSMIQLENVAILRSKGTNLNVKSPVDISLIQTCEWLTHQIIGYKIDLGEKLEFADTLDFRNIESLSKIQSSWEICDSIDFKEQVTIQERLKYLKLFG